MTRAILKSITHKNNLFKMHKNNIDNKDIETEYKMYRNALTGVIR
jgi:hypothetical protein